MADLKDLEIHELAPSAFTAPCSQTNVIDAAVQKIFNNDYRVILDILPEPYSLDRLGSAIFYRVPLLLGLGHDLSRMNAIELGCGRGLKSIAWSNLFGRYWGIDLDKDLIGFARRAAGVIGRHNLEFVAANAAEVIRSPHRFGIEGRIDCVILYAVLEHLTLGERRSVLEAVQELLAGGGLLIVAETPNRLIPHDGHSTFLHFFQMLPTELALAYIGRSPRPEARAIASAADPEEALYRFGQGVSFHEFELFMTRSGSLPKIVQDGWGFWSAFDEPVRRDELELSSYFSHHVPSVGPAFSRFWIEAVFDFAAPPGIAAAYPVLICPEPDPYTVMTGRPQCWTLDMFTCNYPGRLDFKLKGMRPRFLQMDLLQSVGAFEILDSVGRSIHHYEVERLRKARFPREHSRCLIDLARTMDTTQLSVRPIDNASCLVVDGIVASEMLR